jgi:hypothetical protein
MDGRHAGRRDATGLGALYLRQPLFEHGDGRVAEAGVLVMLGGAGEGGLGLLGVVVDEAGGQEYRLGCFAVLASNGPAMHEAGRLAELKDVGHRVGPPKSDPTWSSGWHCDRRKAPVSDIPLASLARLFHLAAIRPDKSRGAETSAGAEPTAERIAPSTRLAYKLVNRPPPAMRV